MLKGLGTKSENNEKIVQVFERLVYLEVGVERDRYCRGGGRAEAAEVLMRPSGT